MQKQRVVSDIYTEMYASSKLDSEAKVELVLKQLGAETDGNQFMHLTSKTHKISENLPPHGDFNMYFRRDVVKAFGDKHLNYKKDLLRQQVHFSVIILIAMQFTIFAIITKAQMITRNC